MNNVNGNCSSGFRFDRPVRDGGYAWWYADAISDDGQHALTLIAFIGSVFSPYYAWANRKAAANPENHCAMNVALYGPKARWAMTERSAKHLSRSETRLQIGPSSLQWDGKTLTAEIEEITVPIPRRLRGQIRLTPPALQPETFILDSAGRHRWRPIAPAARIEVRFERPELSWSGQAYFDHNEGDAPLAQDFRAWHWSRAATPEGARILYDVEQRGGARQCLGLDVSTGGIAQKFTPPPVAALPGTLWRIDRQTRADEGSTPKILKTLEDAPFYARSMVSSDVNGHAATAIHESLSLDRFASPWVRMLLPFRMPRV